VVGKEAIAMSLKPNVVVPVAALVPAGTAGAAISALRAQRAAAGLDVQTATRLRRIRVRRQRRAGVAIERSDKPWHST
jgi:hypothetical protein